MKSNSCWTFLNGPNAFGSASDWIGQWFIQHPSKLSVSDWIENCRVFKIHSQALHTNKSTLSHTSKSSDSKSNALPFQHYSSSFHIEFDFNAVILQRSCSGHSCTSWRTTNKYCKSSFAERSWKENTDTDTLRWCNLVKSCIQEHPAYWTNVWQITETLLYPHLRAFLKQQVIYQ